MLGKSAPDIERITSKQWDFLLSLNSSRSRDHQYSYLSCRQKQNKEKIEVIDEQRKLINAELKEKANKDRLENQHLVYAPGRNAMFLRFRPDTIMKWRHMK